MQLCYDRTDTWRLTE